MLGFLKKIIGTKNEREINRLMPVVNQINSFESAVSALSDEQLKNKTSEFKDRLTAGETLDDILPEAFAVVREASKRTLKMRHFDVQLLGGIILPSEPDHGRSPPGGRWLPGPAAPPRPSESGKSGGPGSSGRRGWEGGCPASRPAPR